MSKKSGFKLLSVGADAKTSKGNDAGFLTGILYLAPHTISGYQVCPMATEGCKAACIFHAGMGVMSNVIKARIKRTVMFFEQRDLFMENIVHDLEKIIRVAKKDGLKPAVRLNGTSDLPFEKIKCERNGEKFNSVFEAFPELSFYDYTKIPGRKKAMRLSNYHLTFSMAEDNEATAFAMLDDGMNVSVVMDLKRDDPKPDYWAGYEVVDGDKHDVRFIDKSGCVVALFAKGKGSKDTSGFVKPAYREAKQDIAA